MIVRGSFKFDEMGPVERVVEGVSQCSSFKFFVVDFRFRPKPVEL